MTRRYAYAPPFDVGTRVRYTGTTTAWFPARGERTDPETDREPDLYPGVEGVVIENHAGLDAYPDVFGPDDEPCDGWSVIELPSGARRAAQRGDGDWVPLDRERGRETQR